MSEKSGKNQKGLKDGSHIVTHCILNFGALEVLFKVIG
jgi:hypothetical protein